MFWRTPGADQTDIFVACLSQTRQRFPWQMGWVAIQILIARLPSLSPGRIREDGRLHHLLLSTLMLVPQYLVEELKQLMQSAWRHFPADCRLVAQQRRPNHRVNQASSQFS